ncbi:TPR domain protein [Aphelenchoides avenae]|nr:TPR domain protein [Aphelenchus avenae]
MHAYPPVGMFLLRRISSRKREEERAEPDGLLRLEKTEEPPKGIEQLLEQGYFSRAYKEAERALADGKDKERCLLILGRAAYGLRKWELSVRHYGELLRASPSNEVAQDGLRAALSCLAEARTGNYDFARLYESSRRGQTDIDVADYVGPIEVVDIPGKGKGIVATRNLKKGTLLLVSKAFAIAPTSLPYSALLTAIEEKLARQPERIDDVADLYYGCERNATATQKSDWGSVTDPDRLMRLASYNAFQAEGFDHAPGRFLEETQRGLWILPSYFNHSCLQNAHRTFYGDVMTAFTVVDVKQGEELTFGYMPLMTPYERRTKHLWEFYDVVCDCRLCEADSAYPICSKHVELVKETIETWNDKREEAIPAVTLLVEQIREMYVGRSELRTQLFMPLKALANAHHAKEEHAEAVQYLLEAVQCVPESWMTVYGIWAYVQMAVCYDLMRRPRTAHRYAQMAADLHRICSGHDYELFKKIYRNVAHLL